MPTSKKRVTKGQAKQRGVRGRLGALREEREDREFDEKFSRYTQQELNSLAHVWTFHADIAAKSFPMVILDNPVQVYFPHPAEYQDRLMDAQSANGGLRANDFVKVRWQTLLRGADLEWLDSVDFENTEIATVLTRESLEAFGLWGRDGAAWAEEKQKSCCGRP